MNYISGTLRNLLLGDVFRLNFATAAAKSSKKSIANKNAKPEKQKFMKKQKQAASKEMATARKSGGIDRAAPFARALFTVDNQNSEIIGPEEFLRRKMIAKSWSRFTMLQLHKESEFEANFLKSRMKALQELQQISPVLAEKASEIYYEAAPITIKPASETKPDTLPFE